MGPAPTLISNPAMDLNPLPVRTTPPNRGRSRATALSPVWAPVEGCLPILQVRWEGRR